MTYQETRRMLVNSQEKRPVIIRHFPRARAGSEPASIQVRVRCLAGHRLALPGRAERSDIRELVGAGLSLILQQ